MEILLLNSKRSQLERIAGPERRSCYVWRCFAFMLLVWFRKLVTIRVTLWYTGIHLAKWWASIAFCVIKESINREKDKVHGQGCQPASCWATATCRYWCQPFGEGGREYLAKFLKLIFWEEVGLSKLYSWPLASSWSKELWAVWLMMCFVPSLQVTIGMSLLSGDPCFKTWVSECLPCFGRPEHHVLFLFSAGN